LNHILIYKQNCANFFFIFYHTTIVKYNVLDDVDFKYDKGIKKISLGESSKRKLNFDESPPLINKYQSNNSQTNFNITSEPIEFQSASIDNLVVVAGKI